MPIAGAAFSAVNLAASLTKGVDPAGEAGVGGPVEVDWGLKIQSTPCLMQLLQCGFVSSHFRRTSSELVDARQEGSMKSRVP